MGYCLLVVLFSFLSLVAGQANGDTDVLFDQNYDVTWAEDHVSVLDQGREIQLSLDQSSGAGFVSKLSYESGFFEMKMKLPEKDSTGVIIIVYLNSTSGSHSELDIEFLDGRGLPYILQTNVYANGTGDREQGIHLWFDPVAEFHDYLIFWNQHQIVVFKNNTQIGVSYPTSPMQIVGTIWEADWAASSGQEVNWSQAPFEASYRGFDIQGCQQKNFSSDQQCNSWWNWEKYWELSPDQLRAYQNVRAQYMYYDYLFRQVKVPKATP